MVPKQTILVSLWNHVYGNLPTYVHSTSGTSFSLIYILLSLLIKKKRTFSALQVILTFPLILEKALEAVLKSLFILYLIMCLLIDYPLTIKGSLYA